MKQQLKNMTTTTFNVKTAGATGDGRTDDTAVFQKLLDLAAESQATVEVPPGTYCVGRLKMHSHTGITGSPAYAWKGNGGSTLKLIEQRHIGKTDRPRLLNAARTPAGSEGSRFMSARVSLACPRKTPRPRRSCRHSYLR